MTKTKQHRIACSCGYEFETQLYESVNTQLSPEAVERFLQGELNRPECPSCRARTWTLIPVLFNDMERNFMVWVGNPGRADGYVEQVDERFPAIIYAANYLAALAALAMFRADPQNAIIPWAEMDGAKVRTYVESYLRLYEAVNFARENEACRRIT